MTTSKVTIEKEARRLLEDALYTYKGHYNASDLWQRWHLLLGIPATALGASAAGAATQANGWLTGGLAACGALLTAALTVINPARRAQRSRAAADLWHAQHDRLRRWINLDLAGLAPAQVRSQLEQFANEKVRLNKGAPAIPRQAQRRAQRGVETGEATHRVDAGATP